MQVFSLTLVRYAFEPVLIRAVAVLGSPFCSLLCTRRAQGEFSLLFNLSHFTWILKEREDIKCVFFLMAEI